MAWEPPEHPARNVKITNDPLDVRRQWEEEHVLEPVLKSILEELRLANELLKGILQ